MNATTTTQANHAALIELLVYCASTFDIDTSFSRPAKIYRTLLDREYLACLSGKPHHKGAKADIEYLYQELGWPLPKPAKHQPIVPTTAQVEAAKAAVAKASKAPSHPPKLTYRELQALAKSLGVKANGTYDAIQARIEGKRTAIANVPAVAPIDQPLSIAKAAQAKAKTAMPDAPKAAPKVKAAKAKRSALTLSYREAQAVVKFCKGCGGFDLSGLVKNTGWDNVEHNLVALAAQPMFAKFDKATLAANPAVAKAVAALKSIAK